MHKPKNFQRNIKDQDSLLLVGDASTIIKKLQAESIQCVVTSPPYWGVRDYGVDGQVGLERTYLQYLTNLRNVFSAVKRVLRSDGTLWLNIGDVYTSGNRKYRAPDKKNPARQMSVRPDTPHGLKPKDLLGLPWKLAFALQEDGWYLRCDIIWHKPNAMPESVKDRPVRSHEYIFLFSKNKNYYFKQQALLDLHKRQYRTVWSVKTEPYGGAHFATFPKKLIEPCILSSSRVGDVVLDPFCGTGTVGLICKERRREFIGIDLNPEYLQLATERIHKRGK